MRKYRITLAFAIATIIFTIVATITINRVLIAVLFLVLLTFIAMADATIQRFTRRELALVETQQAEQNLNEKSIAKENTNLLQENTDDQASPTLHLHNKTTL